MVTKMKIFEWILEFVSRMIICMITIFYIYNGIGVHDIWFIRLILTTWSFIPLYWILKEIYYIRSRGKQNGMATIQNSKQ